MNKTAEATREAFRQFLVEQTGCEVQDGADGNGWPCGTCTMELLNRMGLDEGDPEYHERNPEHDRHNEVWRAILQIRDANLGGQEEGGSHPLTH